MQNLEYYELDNGELIVNVSSIRELDEVMNQFRRQWTWESIEMDVTDGEDGEREVTEWLILIGAVRKQTVGSVDPLSEIDLAVA